jgi:disulfide bond formation protein DsbB
MKNRFLFIKKYGLYLAWVMSLIAILGSLYLSEILGYIPCKLCWIQRIFMYPLGIILGIAAYQNDKNAVKYALPLSVIGGGVSIFHYLIQKMPGLSEIVPCTAGVPCQVDYLNWFGVITIPLLAFIAFAIISLFLYLSKSYS